jgi:hypothetical protein
MQTGDEFFAPRTILAQVLNTRGYAGVPINPDSTSVSFIPRGALNGEAKLKLLINVASSCVFLC